MNLVLVKLFAMALALGQVTTRPEAVKTEFDPVQDQAEVADILQPAAPICARPSTSRTSTSTN